MSKSIPLIIGAVLVIALGTLAFTQYGTIGTKEKIITVQKKEINTLSADLELERGERLALIEDNIQLELAVDEMTIKVEQLEKEVKSLKAKVKSQEKVIASLSKSLKTKEKAYLQLEQKFKDANQNGALKQSTIAQLEADKKQLREEMAHLSNLKKEEEVSRLETEDKLMQKRIEEARKREIARIVDQTTISFKQITIHKDQFGRVLSKIKTEKKNNWYYTHVQMELNHDHKDLLLDEFFVIKIVNSDNQDILSYIESNPNFPDSQNDKKGYIFQFNDKMIDVSYYNNQVKMGESYEIQVFYKDKDGKEYMLRNGRKPFIQNRKTLTL